MKKLIITILLFASMVLTLQSQSYKFVAMDRYYGTNIPIDSILVHNMDTKEEQTVYSDSVYSEILSSVEDYSIESELKLYPNPVDDVLNIELEDGNSSILIIADVTGKVHFKFDAQPNQKISLNVASLPTGTYNISYGQHTQNFIKNSVTNGSEVNIISTESTYNSLIKESEVQSQFDYRFTVYCTGFKPKSYYSEAITKDSTITLDMSSLPTSFDGKHIRVELFFKSTKDSSYFNEHGPRESIGIYSKDITLIFFDTLVYRNGRFHSSKFLNFETDGSEYPNYKSSDISFEYDTLNKIINNFWVRKSYDSAHYEDGRRKFVQENSKFQLSISDSLIVESIEEIPVLITINNKEYKFNYYKNKFYDIDGCQGHTNNHFYSSPDPAKSYIKIEIID